MTFGGRMVNGIGFNDGYNYLVQNSKDLEAISKYQLDTKKLQNENNKNVDLSDSQKAALGFTGATIYGLSKGSYKDFETIAKYALGTTIVNGEDSPFAGMGLMVGLSALPELWKGATWLRKAYKQELPAEYLTGLTKEEIKFAKEMANPFSNGGWKKAEAYKEASENIKKSWAKGVNEFKDGYKGFGKNLQNTGVKGVWNNYSAKTVLDAIPNAEKMAKLTNSGSAKSIAAEVYYNRAKNLAEYAKTNPSRARAAISAADRQLARANALAYAEKINKPAEGIWGNITRFLGKYTGYNKANLALKEFAATKSPVTSKILKFGKGNGWFVGMTAGIELLTQVIPSFTQLGAGSGIKQLGKSAAKTGASVGGWVGGMAVGSAIGTMICPAAGTVIGGAIGALCGIIGGCLGSWAATKATEKIVGKDELELAKERQAKELAQQAAQNPEAAQQLLAAAGEKLQAEGQDSEDAKVAFGSLTRLAAQTQTQTANAQSQYAQNFTGNETQQQTNTTNPYKFIPSALSELDYKDKDFMAMSSGLV